MGHDHTQRATWVAALLFIVVAALLVAVVLADMPVLMRVVLGGVAVGFYWLLDTFSRLTVKVESGMALVAFGRGWPQRVIPLNDAVAVRGVRLKWWYGFGIRLIPAAGCGTCPVSTPSNSAWPERPSPWARTNPMHCSPRCAPGCGGRSQMQIR